MKTIRHETLGGGYSMRREIIIDTCEISAGEFETMVMYSNGDELDCITTTTESAAATAFNELFQKYAEPLQKALYNTMQPGKRYTLVFLNDFGFPVAQKITFHAMECTTYAQHSDVVKITCTQYRHRTPSTKRFYNCSVMIFEGWQDLKQEQTTNTIKDTAEVKITQSKYGCFDARYIDDLETAFIKPVAIYKHFRKGANGKIYA